MAHNDIAIFAMERGILKENTLRLIRFGYPLLRVRANILSYKDNQRFSLIKKYIHRLVTGDQPNAKKAVAYVKDRLQAFQLLGLDKELYDVASYYYDELILEGLIHDSPQGALAGAAPANDPALQRIRSSRQAETCLLVDVFSLDIYGQKVSGLRLKTTEELLALYKEDICLPLPPAYVRQPEVLEALINQRNFDFDNCTEEYMTARLQSQNMPQGVRSIELLWEDEEAGPVDIYWLPYYLAWEKTDDGSQYCLYSSTSGKPIDLFPVNSPEHKHLQNFLQQLFQGHYYTEVYYALTDSVKIPLSSGQNKLEKNVHMDADGNYQAALTDYQLALICLEEETEAVSILNLITKGAGVIPTREAGRLVRFSLTQSQQDLCQKILANPQYRHSLILPILKQAADEGNADALYHLGNCFFLGRGTDRNLPQAFSFYQQASAKNHPWAILRAGICLRNGHGTEADAEAAIACWNRLKPNAPSYVLALHNIGATYFLQKDYENAAAAFLKAEEGSFISSFTAFSLGKLYADGLGVEQNAENAVKQYEIAAKWGHIPATVLLASCYIRGTGVEKDPVYAKQLLEQSLQPCPEDRLFFLGAKPFISYQNLICTQEDLESRRNSLKQFQNLANDLLSKL